MAAEPDIDLTNPDTFESQAEAVTVGLFILAGLLTAFTGKIIKNDTVVKVGETFMHCARIKLEELAEDATAAKIVTAVKEHPEAAKMTYLVFNDAGVLQKKVS